MNNASSIISLTEVIEHKSYYIYLFGDKLSEIFGQDILNETRQVLKTCNGYHVNPILSILRKCKIWDLADTLLSEEQENFASELIVSLNSNNFETMDLLDISNQEKIPIKWTKILFEQWTNQLQNDPNIQKKIATYIIYYLGLFRQYTEKLDDCSKSEEVVKIISDYGSKGIEDIESNQSLSTFWENLLQFTSLT